MKSPKLSIFTTMVLAASMVAGAPKPEPAVEGQIVYQKGDLTITKVNSSNPSTNSGVNFQAWSGSQCDTGPGSIITVPTGSYTCIGTPNRHSFELGTGCTKYSITICSSTGCKNIVVTESYGPGCYNVNTGGTWASSAVECG